LSNANPIIFRVAVAVPVHKLFDYLPPVDFDSQDILPGVRLLLPFASGTKVGVLIEFTTTSERKHAQLKHVTRVLELLPLLSQADLQLLQWASRYYHYPLGEVLLAAFPVLLRQGKPALFQMQKSYGLTSAGRLFNANDLHRAKTQQYLLQKVQQFGSVSARQFADWSKNWRQPLKGLMEKGLIQQETEKQVLPSGCQMLEAALPANEQQQFAIAQVCNKLKQFAVFLLQGVTGSGKTEVYLQIIQSVLEQQRQVLVLLPEISLTPQLEERFRKRFANPIAVSHSGLNSTQRLQAWLGMQQDRYSILLGTRSALFVPLKRPGLIILDEEHDTSFKQQEGFRYSTRDVALVRAKMLNIPVIMGSATPSLESLHNAAKKRYHLLHLPQRAGRAVAPELCLIDIRNKKMHEGLSEALLREIGKTLVRKEQVLLFLNRRGFAPVLTCHRCGWVARCQRCDANLVIHHQAGILRCHHCASEQKLPAHCQSCQATEILPLGAGTERVEMALQQYYPQQEVVRLDRDTTQRKGALENYLKKISHRQAEIIIGTQMLAKGHHFPGVTLVAILDVDSGLFSIDYRAGERLAQLITQVAGRAGRAEKPGRVLLQTRHPDHPLLTVLLQRGYREFAETALVERAQAQLPPYSYQALFRAAAADAARSQVFLETLVKLTQQAALENVQLFGPVPAPMAKRAGRFRYQLLLNSGNRQALHRLLDRVLPAIATLPEARKVRWSLDIDPVDLY